MTKNYEMIFRLIDKTVFHNEDFKYEAVDWEALSSELKQHSIYYVPADEILTLELSDAEKNTYMEGLMKQAATWNVVMYEQQAIVDAFKKMNIPMVIIKGCTSAMYYPVPEYRTMGDIDIVVLPEDFKRAHKVLEDMGYVRHTFNEHREILLKKQGVEVELHPRFSIMNDDEHAKYLDALIYKGIKEPEHGSIYSYTFPMLPKLERGLICLSHISQHMEGGLGLRQILDWMLYVHTEVDDAYWNDVFAKEVEKIGLKQLAIVTTRMCQMYFGLPDNITWCKKADANLCEELMDYIMNNGNFGGKDAMSRKTMFVLRIMRRPWRFFASLQSAGSKTWLLLRKYPWLKPFAWIYQLFRWANRGLHRKDFAKNMVKDMKKARREDVFFDNLGVVRRYRGLNNKKGKH